MMLLLTSQPLWMAAILLGLVTLLAMGASLLIRRRVELARLGAPKQKAVPLEGPAIVRRGTAAEPPNRRGR